MSRAIVAAGLIAVMPAAPSAARDFLYPWKPGIALQQVSDDQSQCAALAREAEKQVNRDEQARLRGQPAPPPPPDSRTAISPGLDGLHAFFNGYCDCLRSRGYSIRRMPKKEYNVLKKQDRGLPVLQAMAASSTPHAEVPPGVIK